MELRQIKAFATIYDELNISQAARTLLVSQQALSQTLKDLENNLGFILFERTQNGVIPTENAHLLIEHVRELLESYDKLESCILDIKNQKQPIRFAFIRGSVDPLGALDIPGFLSSTSLELEIPFAWHCMTTTQCIQALQDNTIDIALVVTEKSAQAQGIAFHPTRELQPFIMVSSSNPLARKPHIVPEDIFSLNFAVPQDDPYCSESIQSIFQQSHFDNEPSLTQHNQLDQYLGSLVEKDEFSMIAWRACFELFNTDNSAIIPFPSEIATFTQSIIIRENDQNDSVVIACDYLAKRYQETQAIYAYGRVNKTPPVANGLTKSLESLKLTYHLTNRELEIIQELSYGKSKQTIAQSLFISESTVSTHVKHIYAKLGIHSKQELIGLVYGA